MKKTIFICSLLILIAAGVQAQSGGVGERTSEVTGIMDQHLPTLSEFQEKLAEHKAHLEERIIVLKYHKGNKEVMEACRIVVENVEKYYNDCTAKVQEFESQWFDQTRNITAIYTRYGELREATGGGSNELQSFVDSHTRYLDLLENIKSDLIGVYTDLSFIKNNI